MLMLIVVLAAVAVFFATLAFGMARSAGDADELASRALDDRR